MYPLRGLLMVVAAAIAFYRGWTLRHSDRAWIAFALGAVALSLAIWHLTRAGRENRSPRA
jgi:membrane protein YdbS with pleckstrin-like domain